MSETHRVNRTQARSAKEGEHGKARVSETHRVNRTQARSAKEGEHGPSHMRPILLPLLLLSVLLAGCHQPLPGDEETVPEWALPGTFTEDARQEHFDDLRDRLEPYDARLMIMESFPMQYRIEGPHRDDCPEVQEMVRGLAYIAEVGNCLAVTAASEPAQPTSSPAE